AYAQSAVAPGELLMMVGEEEETVGVPVTCLAEAYAGAVTKVEEDLLHYLSTSVPAAAMLPLVPTDVPTVGRLARNTSLGVAHAVVVSERLNACIATRHGTLLRRLGIYGGDIIDL